MKVYLTLFCLFLPYLLTAEVLVVMPSVDRSVEIDYSEEPCGDDLICPKEQLAIDRHTRGFNDALKLNQNKIEATLGLYEQSLKIFANSHMFSKSPDDIEKIRSIKKKMVSEIVSEIKNFKIYERYKDKYPDAKCLFPNSNDTVYLLCSHEKLSDKFLSLGSKNTAKFGRYLEIANMMKADIDSYRNQLEQTRKDILADTVIQTTYSNVPSLSVIGTPSKWIGLIRRTFSNFAMEARRFSTDVKQLASLREQMLNDKDRKTRLSMESAELKKLLADEKARAENNLIRRKDLQKIVVNKTRMKKQLEIDFGANIDNHLQSEFYKIGPTKLINVEKNRVRYLIDGGYQIDVPPNSLKASIKVLDPVKLQAHGVFALGGHQFEHLPKRINGTFTSLDGYYAPFLRQWWYRGRHRGGSGSNVYYRIFASNNQVRHSSTPDPFSAVGVFTVNSNGTRFRPQAVGTSAMVPAYGGSTLTLNINDYNGPGATGWIDLDRSFGVSVNFYGSSKEVFRNIMTEIDGSKLLGTNIAYSANPHQDGLNIMKSHLIDKMGHPKEIVDIFNPYIELKISQQVLEKEITRASSEMALLRNQALASARNLKAIKLKIEELEKIDEGQKHREVITKTVDSYIRFKLDFGRTQLRYYLEDLERWLFVYAKSVQYHYPDNVTLKAKNEAIISVLEAYLKTEVSHYDSPGESLVADYTREKICDTLSSLDSGYNDLCDVYEEDMEISKLNGKLARFFYESDRDLTIDNMVVQKDLMHCYIDFSKPIGLKYLKEKLGSNSIKDVFNREGNRPYFVSIESPEFQKSFACSLRTQNPKICRSIIENGEAEEKTDLFKDWLGYYQIPLTTLYDGIGDNLICDTSSEMGPPNFLGVSFEWSPDDIGDIPHIPPKLTGYIEKSAYTSWNGNDYQGNTVHHKVLIYDLGDSSSVADKYESRDIRQVNIVERNHIEGNCINNGYTTRECIEKLFGQVVVGNKYQFRTAFLNSRIENDWIFYLPLLKEKNELENYNHVLADHIKNLKVNFYFEAKRKRQSH